MADSDKLKQIAGEFATGEKITEVKPLGTGFINDTYIAEGADGTRFILQHKNRNVFPDVPSMMDNIEAVAEHIRKKAVACGGNPERATLTLVRTHDGKLYHEDEAGEFWTVCRFIEGSVTYERADSPELAYKGGKGIGKFQTLLSDFQLPLAETIKGFHNIRHRFEQWDEALRRDEAGRVASLREEIGRIESRRKKMLDFWRLVEDGTIPRRVTHNDTKISNILFDEAGEVLCVIDLDTVMSSTSLNDFGDAIRSYANTGAEDDKNLENVGIDLDMFRAYAKGYLEERADTLTYKEIEYLAFSALYITYEQVLRFLMDYIDGDTYYKTAYPEHNLIRTHAQYKLLESMEAKYNEMREIINELYQKSKKK